MSEKRKVRKQDQSSSGMDQTMSLVGKLEDLSLGEILQIVSLSRRSGLLRLQGPLGEATMYIQGGMIIHAGRSDETEGILSLLVHHGLIDMSQIEALKGRIEACRSREKLKVLLNNELNISPESFQKALRKRVEELVYSLFLWEEGTFSFQLVDSESEIPVLESMRPFFLDDGINAQFLVMEGARRKDELMRDMGDAESITAGEAQTSDLDDGWQDLLSSEDEISQIAEDETTQPDITEVTETGLTDLPETIPDLPGRIAKVLVLVTEDESLRPVLQQLLGEEDVAVFAFPDSRSALARIQELHAHNIFPVVASDLRAGGVTDGIPTGRLDILTGQWDLGFSLPSILLVDERFPGGLKEQLSPLRCVDLLLEDQQNPPGRLAELVLSAMTPEAPPVEDGAEFYDIRQELSEDLEGLDLPFEISDGQEYLSQPPSTDPLTAKLGSYVSELNRQDIRGEITLLALRFATEFASRAILFLARKTDIKGLGQFGVDLGEGKDADAAIRTLEIPITEESIFTRVIRSQQSYRGAPTESETERQLFDQLGGESGEIYIGPVVSMGKVAVILYGDDFPDLEGLQPTHTLDIFLSHTGLALDRAFLEMKLKSERKN